MKTTKINTHKFHFITNAIKIDPGYYLLRFKDLKEYIEE